MGVVWSARAKGSLSMLRCWLAQPIFRLLLLECCKNSTQIPAHACCKNSTQSQLTLAARSRPNPTSRSLQYDNLLDLMRQKLSSKGFTQQAPHRIFDARYGRHCSRQDHHAVYSRNATHSTHYSYTFTLPRRHLTKRYSLYQRHVASALLPQNTVPPSSSHFEVDLGPTSSHSCSPADRRARQLARPPRQLVRLLHPKYGNPPAIKYGHRTVQSMAIPTLSMLM